MKLLSERLTDLRRYLPRSFWDEMDACIEQAQTMESKNVPLQRNTDPETSWYDGSIESLNTLRLGVLDVFRSTYIPMDEVTMNARYVEMQLESDWMKFVDPSKGGGTIRKRRNELEQAGLLKRIDSDGKSLHNQPTGRYACTKVGREL